MVDDVGHDNNQGATASSELPELPDDIFVLILDRLDAWDVVRCQKVSKLWRQAFSRPDCLRLVLKKYPKAREMRTSPHCFAATCNVEPYSHGTNDKDCRATFNDIASRYYHLSRGKARSVVKHKIMSLEQYGYWFPIGQWDYHESQPGGRLYYENAATHLGRLGTKPYLFRSTLWSYDDGLLAIGLVDDEAGGYHSDQPISILDIASNTSYAVPFKIRGKIIRNFMLRNRTLVVEWAEKEPFHDLTDSEKVHRHFATCYDVTPILPSQSAEAEKKRKIWEVNFRNEWKMHFLGLPLNSRDRFFSVHNGKHYAVYFWQPNRSMYTGDEDMPIEALFVWDISTPSPYLPSSDPAGKRVPAEENRAHPVSRFSFRDLDFIGVRQHANISFMSLSLDSEGQSVAIRENMCVAGQGYFDPAERLMCATTTSFPFVGQGPALCRVWHGNLPPYRGHCSMESTDVEEPERWFLPIMDIHDEAADVKLSLVETCFTGSSMQNRLEIRLKSMDEWISMDDKVVNQIAGMGRIAGDERWIIGQNSQMEVVIVKF